MNQKINKIILWIILPPTFIMIVFMLLVGLSSILDSPRDSVQNSSTSKCVFSTPTPTPFPLGFFDYRYSFEDFLVTEVYTGNPAKINFASHPKASTFQTMLKRGLREINPELVGGLKEGESANFAGHYVLLTWGCGSSCTTVAVVDAKNGNVYFPPIGSYCGVKYDLKSNLLVVNPPEDVKSFAESSSLPNGVYTMYYKWRNNEFIEIKDEAQTKQ